MEVFLPVSSPNGTYSVSVDPKNLIAEKDENNNTFFYLAITPTPPTLCPPTETPLPPSVPTSASGNSVLFLNMIRFGVYHSPDWGEYQLTDGVYYRTPSTVQESPKHTPAVFKTRFFTATLTRMESNDGLCCPSQSVTWNFVLNGNQLMQLP